MVELVPNEEWGGAGLLGVTIRMDNYGGECFQKSYMSLFLVRVFCFVLFCFNRPDSNENQQEPMKD